MIHPTIALHEFYTLTPGSDLGGTAAANNGLGFIFKVLIEGTKFLAKNAGTFNYYNPETNGSFGHPLVSNNQEHIAFDVIPYYLLGNSEQDPTGFGDRVIRNAVWFKVKAEQYVNEFFENE